VFYLDIKYSFYFKKSRRILRKLIIYFSIIFFNYTLLAQKEGFARITCRVLNSKESYLNLTWLKGYVSEQEEKISYAIGNSVEFTHQWSLSEPMEVKMWYNDRPYTLYIEPGDDFQISFDGQKYPESLIFMGHGGAHNTFLRKYTESCKSNNDRIVTGKINELTPMNYRDWLMGFHQQHLNFWKNYPEEERNDFSNNFKKYVFAEIDFWKTYHLLRYKEEHETASVFDQNLIIPDNYYDFLNQTTINSHQILCNSLYRKSLELYLKYRQNKPSSTYGITNNQIWLKVTFEELDLLDSPYSTKTIGKIKQEDVLLVTDKMTFGGGQYGIATAYRIKVRAIDGQEGWIKSYGVEILSNSQLNQAPVTLETLEKSIRRIGKVAKVAWVEVKGMNEPYENGVLFTSKFQDELIYLNQATESNYNYKIDTFQSINDIFLKVKNQQNTAAWIPSQSVSLLEKEFTQSVTSERISKNSSSIFNNIDYFLSGKSLCYAVGKDIQHRLHFEKPEKLRPALDSILKVNNDTKFATELNSIFNGLQHNVADDNAQAQSEQKIINTRTFHINIPLIRFRLDEQVSASIKSSSSKVTVKNNVSNDTLQRKFIASPPTTIYPLFKTTVSGTLGNVNGSDLSLSILPDYINLAEKSYLLDIQADKTFKTDIYLSEAVVGELIYGQDSVPIWLAPRDSVMINYSGASQNKSLNCSGRGAEQITFLYAFKNFSKKIESELKGNLHDAQPPAFKSFLEYAKKEKQRFLDEYQGNQAFSLAFRRYLQADIDYWYAFNLLNYPWEHPLYYDETAPMKVSESYFDGLKNIPLQNDEALTNRYYRYFIEQYVSNLKLLPENEYFSKEKIAENHFQNKTLAYLKAKYTVQFITPESNEILFENAENYIKNTTFPLYSEAVKNTLLKNISIKKEVQAPDFQLFNAEGFPVTLKEYIGRVVHIDFWATWCKPCLEAMKKTEEMRLQFNNKDVVFLYINTENNRSKWLRYVDEHSLDKTRHIFGITLNPYALNAEDLYKTDKLPAVYLLNKDGSIVIDPSIRLESNQMAEQISELIK
jgi:thiol-disulfide isomerase/thioredoxin